MNSGKKRERISRSSNLELYRILCMLMIVAHHYVVNSGLMPDGPLVTDPLSSNSVFLRLFGAWGKVGINCFLMITGYFMCTSTISFRKFLKLFSQIIFYRVVIFSIFLLTGYELFSLKKLVPVLIPFWNLEKGFVSCFLVFYLTIPFWNILISNMTIRKHQLLLVLLLTCYSIMGSLPFFHLTFNYITWFGIIYLIASYIRRYPLPLFENGPFWGFFTLVCVLLAVVSILFMQARFSKGYFFVVDSNKILAVLIAISSFLWFKNIKIKQSKIINTFGAATFGVLLIHANSNAMRVWLWKDTVDVLGHYSLPLGELILFSIGVVVAVFVLCSIIDWLRLSTFERWFFKWYDRVLSVKADSFFNRIISNNDV